MSSGRVVVDALSRALCPSVDARLLCKAIETPSVLGRHACVGRLGCAKVARRGLLAGPVRAIHRRQPGFAVTASQLVCANSDYTPLVFAATTSAVYEAIRLLRRRKDQATRIRHFVNALVKHHGERPNVVLYDALVTANWDTTTGSARQLKAILNEMKTVGVVASPSFYHSALRLLAIHPDYLLMISILKEMEKRGIRLEDDGKCSVAVGLLRDNQYEMALEYLDQMCRDRAEIPGWVFDVFFYVLAARGFVDEAVQLLHQRLRMADGQLTVVPLGVWYYLLDECSRGLHYGGTRFIWDKMVQLGTLNPSDGLAANVLNTAARHGDSALATKVIQLLSARSVKLGIHHYEALLDCYVQAGDLENAFEVLCIMTGAGIQPDQSSTRSIFLLLRRSPERTDEAISILSNLSKQHALPIAAINVLLEAAAKRGDMTRTLDVCRQACELCPSGPNQQTFSPLLQECGTAEAAALLASEMDRFHVRPSPAMLEDLARCFAHDGSLDAALSCLAQLSEATSSRSWASENTLRAVLERCYREKDARAWAIVREAERRGLHIDGELMGRLAEISTTGNEAVAAAAAAPETEAA